MAKRNRNKKINWKVENNKKATEKKLKELAFIGKKLFLTIVAKNTKIIKKVKKGGLHDSAGRRKYLKTETSKIKTGIKK